MKEKIFKIAFIFLFIVCSYKVVSQAAISATSKTVNSGEQVSISITSNIPVTSYAVSVTDNGGLTFVTSSGGTGAGTTKITDAKTTGMTSLATFTFKVPEVTKDTKYKASFLAEAMDDVNDKPIDNSTTSATITVKAKNQANPTTENPNNGNTGNGNSNVSDSNPAQTTTQTPSEETKKSNNANLSNLGIRPNDFTGFRAGTTNYNVEVPNDVESVEVYATKADKNAKVTGTGTKTLKEGANALTVEVTAEDGTTKKTYTINVTRKTKEETENEENEENENAENNTETELENTENSKGLQTLKIGDLSLNPTFKTNVYEYKVKYIGADEKLNIEAKATDDTYKVDITGNEKLVEGENLITILVSDEKGENVATYQITVEKSLIDVEAVAKEEERLQKERQNLIIIIGIILAVIIVGVIAFFIIRNRKKYDEEYDDDYDENYDEDDVEDVEKNEEFDDNVDENKEELKQKYLDNFDSNDYNNEYNDYDNRKNFFKRSNNKGKRFK